MNVSFDIAVIMLFCKNLGIIKLPLVFLVLSAECLRVDSWPRKVYKEMEAKRFKVIEKSYFFCCCYANIC